MPEITRELLSLPQRILDKIAVDSSGCWMWTAASSNNGYGHVATCGGKTKLALAHRFVYELLIGAIPDGLHLDHLCRKRACVRPSHLEPVTVAVNNARQPKRSPQPRKTHCKHGHCFDAQNTYLRSDGTRSCRKCGALSVARKRQQHRIVS